MVFAVLGAVAFKNASRRNAIRDALATKLAPAGMWGDPIVRDQAGLTFRDTPDPAIYVEVRFLAETDRDAFYADAAAQLTGANGPTTGSWLAKHDCSHDEPEHRPCVETERRVF